LQWGARESLACSNCLHGGLRRRERKTALCVKITKIVTKDVSKKNTKYEMLKDITGYWLLPLRVSDERRRWMRLN
jgi:hypothetical protein